MEVCPLTLPVAMTQALPIRQKTLAPAAGNGNVKTGLNMMTSYKKRSSNSSSRRANFKICSVISNPPAAPSPSSSAAGGINNGKPKAEEFEKVHYWDLHPETGELVKPSPKGLSDDELQLKEYLANILSAPVYDDGVAVESALDETPLIFEHHENLKNSKINVFLKREDRQIVYSFKLRGAYNMISRLSEEDRAKGLVCASAGNHAQGVALAAKMLDCHATICMPRNTPDIKVEAVKRIGGDHVEVKQETDSYDEASTQAHELADEFGYTYVAPFDNKDVIAGQGTIALELARQMKRPTYAIFVPIGGGGIVSGIATFMRSVYPNVKIIGVEPYEANSMAFAFYKDKRVTLDPIGTFADGVAVATVGEENFKLSRELLDGVVLVDRDYISAAIKDVYDQSRMIVEPSGALSVAGARAYCEYYKKEDINVVAILSGANMDFDQLKVIVDYANLGQKREAIYATFLPEEPGSFRKFTQIVDSLSITECKYRYQGDKEKALVYYRVRYNLKPELEALEKRLESSQFQTTNLSNNDLVIEHLKHLVGNRGGVENEVLYRFILPERVGAVKQFADAFCPRWNITLFNYRAQGELSAYVLVGFQVPPNEIKEFEDCADKLGFRYEQQTNNTAFQLLMQ